MKKVARLLNPGDLVTKHLSRERIDCYSKLLNYRFAEGRAEVAAGLDSRNIRNRSVADGVVAIFDPVPDPGLFRPRCEADVLLGLGVGDF